MNRTEFEEKDNAYAINVASCEIAVRHKYVMIYANPAFMGSDAARKDFERQTAEAIEIAIERQMAYERKAAEFETFGAQGREAVLAKIDGKIIIP